MLKVDEFSKIAEQKALHPDHKIIRFCDSELGDVHNYQQVRISRIVVDKATNQIDGEYLYFRDEDWDILKDVPWSNACDDDELFDDDEAFEKWLDGFEWEDVIAVFFERK